MYGAFINRFGSLLDRRFLLGSWFPALCGSLLLGTAYALAHGWRKTIKEWEGFGAPAQLWLGVVAVAAVTLIAFLLHVAPIIRLFEGYPWPGRIKRWGLKRQTTRKERASEAVSLRDYPRNRELIRPTRLGNLLTAAEEHSYLRYRIDAVVWWPRFVPVFAQVFRDQLDEALLPLIALTTFSLALSAGGTAGAILLVFSGHCAGGLLYAGASLAVATLAYRAALAQAGWYASCIRAGFDLYRHEMLVAMKLTPPTDLIAERRQGEELTQWIYRGEPPADPWLYAHPPAAGS